MTEIPSRDKEESQQEQPLTELQVEAEGQTERINEASEAAKRVKEALKDLRYEPPTQEEQEKIAGIRGINLRTSQELSVKTGIAQRRMQQLINREKSISYILSAGGNISYQDLKNARFFSIKGMAEKKERAASLFSELDKGLRDSDLLNDSDSLQELAKEHGFRDERFFDVDEESGVAHVKDLDEESIKKFRQIVSLNAGLSQWDADMMRDLIKNSRTGIDPGLLIIISRNKKLHDRLSETDAGGYSPGVMFSGDLGKTGIIVLPVVFPVGVVRHEYKHFEDYLFGAGYQRRGADRSIEEMIGIMNGMPENLKKETDAYFGIVKEAIKECYLPKYKTSEPVESAEKRVDDAVEVLKRLYNNGFPLEAINSILMQSKKLEDILQWKNASEEEIRGLSRSK